jgi:hypothetical protein
MLRGRSATLFAGARSALSGVVALLALALLFEAPALLLPEPVRATGEVLVLLSLYVASLPLGALGLAVRTLLGFATFLLVAYRVDRIAFVHFMGEEPLLYDQLFMVRHLFVLAWDLWSWQVVGFLVATLFGVVFLFAIVGWLLGIATRTFGPSRAPAWLAGLALFWGAAFLVSFAEPDDATPGIRWLRPAIAANVAESWRIHDAVRRGLQESPYRELASLRLTRKPDVYLFFIESYGRFAIDDARVGARLQKRLRLMEDRARRAGWHAASGFSRAPVSGGRSWLAEASVLMGTEVRYEAVFHHLVGDIEHVPNLVGVLGTQGYHTVLLAPADRARPGIEDVNHYRFARQVRFDDLDYFGTQYGWGIVPDQFSLEFTHEEVLRRAPRPLFFDFHMVSSHAPWANIPRLVDDWHELRVESDTIKALVAGDDTALRSEEEAGHVIERRLERYVDKTRRHRYLGEYTARLGKRYARAIDYELELIERYLPKIAGDALVIVMGDHQPPFVAEETRSYDVPVHVLARDGALLAEFRAQGFADGLDFGASAVGRVRHEGLFSLVMRTLARVGGVTPDSLPEYRPRGATLVQ